jgi:hypothetical protein
MREALRAFARTHPDKRVTCTPFPRLNDAPELRQGDWHLVGVLVELTQWIVCVNGITRERRVVKGWEKAYALKDGDHRAEQRVTSCEPTG